MNFFNGLPLAGSIVIVIIAVLFFIALIVMFSLCGAYRRYSRHISAGDANADLFLRGTADDFAAVYKVYGSDTNTPAIITNSMGNRLGRLLLGERFLNNAVSLFVTLGLFGTFLGLSLSVVSLTQLIGYSNTSEWLSVLDSVGSGLMSALSGMGVAFYTSLVGAGCSILLTLLRTIFNPQSRREQLATQLELWLDHSIAPELPTRAAKDDEELIHQMIDGLNKAADSMEKTLNDATASMRKTMEDSKPYLVAFHQTVEKFNNGVHDFSEVDYNFRGTVERLDVAARDMVNAVRQTARSAEKGANR